MTSAVRTTIPLKEGGHYRPQNFNTQDEQVSTPDRLLTPLFRTPMTTGREEW